MTVVAQLETPCAAVKEPWVLMYLRLHVLSSTSQSHFEGLREVSYGLFHLAVSEGLSPVWGLCYPGIIKETGAILQKKTHRSSLLSHSFPVPQGSAFSFAAFERHLDLSLPGPPCERHLYPVW